MIGDQIAKTIMELGKLLPEAFKNTHFVRQFWVFIALWLGMWLFVSLMTFTDVWFYGGQRFEQLLRLLDKL